MRKLQRFVAPGLSGGAVLTAITSIALFIKGIWTPEWHRVTEGFSGCEGGCYQYQANHQWLATAWVFLIVTILLAVGRFVMWLVDENDHGH